MVAKCLSPLFLQGRERERGRYLLNATTNKQTNMLKSKDAASSLVSKISLT
jgi:hypothetical protein